MLLSNKKVIKLTPKKDKSTFNIYDAFVNTYRYYTSKSL